MDVCITIDMEHDCPPYLSTYRGVVDGFPRFMSVLDESNIPGTFFTTGDVARRFPDVIQTITARGHELGCHGDTHARFSTLNAQDADMELRRASSALRRFGLVTSFRAPNLDLPGEYLSLLRTHQYRLDSSQGRHKPGSLFVRPSLHEGLARIPACLPPSVIRLPRIIRNRILRAQRSPVVLFFHPWEFVDVTAEPIPYDCRFRTGEPAVEALRDTIEFYRSRGAVFKKMQDVKLS